MDPDRIAQSFTSLLAQHSGKGGQPLPGHVQDVVGAVSARLGDRPSAASALDRLTSDPGNPRKQVSFRRHLVRSLKDDPAFAAELVALLGLAQAPVGIDQRGSGAVATGGSVAAGAGGMAIAGNVVNSTIIFNSVVSDEKAPDLEDLPPEPGEPPYQGLQYFDERDAGRFFGREGVTSRVIGRLGRTRFLAVIGASGSGKSSLLRAGVIPALKSGERLADGSLPPSGSAHWVYRVFNPGGHPLDSLAAALSADGAPPSQLRDLRDELAARPDSLALAAQGLLAHEKSPHLLLVVDQMEEIFSQARSPQERDAFIDALVAASEPTDSQPLTILVSLRADFYARVAQHERLRELVSQRQEFIGAMSRAELVDAIVGPLVQGGWKIQEGLVKVILDDVGYEPGALPLLSHCLLETWKRRRGRTLTLSGYVECGGVDGAIRETADAVFRQRLTPEQRPIARMIFLRLAELNEDAQDTRRRASFSELITRSTDEMTIQAVIDILVDARLVTTGTAEPGDTKVIEVAHESLIREWPTLREWLDQDRQGLILHRHLTEAAEDWVENGCDAGLLFRGTRLQHARDWAATPANAETLSLEEAEFLGASEANAALEAEKEARLARLKRRQRIFVAVTASLLLVVSVLAYVTLRPPPPPTMTGLYNVAVAGIGEIGPAGEVRAVADGGGALLTGEIATTLQDSLADSPDVLVWSDTPGMKPLRVEIGAVESDAPDGQTQAAADLAARLGADMVIYEILDPRGESPVLTVGAYLAPSLSDALDELPGVFQLTSPIPVTSTLDSEPVRAEAARQAELLAVLARAGSESRLGHTLEALESYLRAAQLAPHSDMLQFFVAREYLFSLEREPVLQAAGPAFEARALETLQGALAMNPGNARAYVALGSLYMKQARRIVQRENGGVLADADFAAAAGLLGQAAAAYSRVLELHADPAAYGVPVEEIARLGLGNARLLSGITLQAHGELVPARAALDESVRLLQETLPAFQDPALTRYLAQNHQFLGSAYQWSGRLYERDGDFPAAIEAYRSAMEQHDACIALGESSADRIIQSEIVAANCEPDRQITAARLDRLSGGP
jgi:tetratricopeptide (TPR) repeat protein/energy-coupling factor transporter ATP-binding protein EcfA2